MKPTNPNHIYPEGYQRELDTFSPPRPSMNYQQVAYMLFKAHAIQVGTLTVAAVVAAMIEPQAVTIFAFYVFLILVVSACVWAMDAVTELIASVIDLAWLIVRAIRKGLQSRTNTEET